MFRWEAASVGELDWKRGVRRQQMVTRTVLSRMRKIDRHPLLQFIFNYCRELFEAATQAARS